VADAGGPPCWDPYSQERIGSCRVSSASSKRYAQLSRLEEGRNVLHEALRLEPGLSIARIKADLLASADPSFLEPYLEGLREAGLKEE
jgi:hypothetical protein